MKKEPKGQIYRGRFAPSPSGPLHFGSLITALGSYLQARSKSGEWLVRMEDLDPPREMPGADVLILKSLEAHGLHWDSDVIYQSTRHQIYDEALDNLHKKGLLFYCSCTNKQLKTFHKQSKSTNSILASGVYPGICRQQTQCREHSAIRIRVTEQTISFNDQVFGTQTQNLANEVGDFILKRKDGLYAYQLAVVVDDIAQDISEVVRGVDLLDSTPRQIYLYQCFNVTPPDYMHLPLALLPNLKKLSKQTGATALINTQARSNLLGAMNFLGMNAPEHLLAESLESILNWGIQNWNVSTIPTQDTVI